MDGRRSVDLAAKVVDRVLGHLRPGGWVRVTERGICGSWRSDAADGKIDQHFSAGSANPGGWSPVEGRQERVFRPSGTLVPRRTVFPALKRWAIFEATVW